MVQKRLARLPLKDCLQIHGQREDYVFLENNRPYLPERTS